MGPGLNEGPPRFGGALSFGYDLPGRAIGVGMVLAEALRPSAVGAVDMTWTRLGVGMSLSGALPFGTAGRAALLVVAERVAADETDPVTLAEESRSRWLSGVEADLSLRWPRLSRVGGIIGGYAVRLSGGTAVVSHGVELASSPATEGGFLAGIEFRL
jgi:hypothetical protein